jgi:hypothetical protein
LTIQNTILAQNTASAAGPDVDFTMTPTGVDLGGNLIGIGDPAVFTAGTTQQGTATNPLNPLLGPLTNNGGPLAGSTGHQFTVETEAVLPGSPAIGTGVANGIAFDERNAPRVNTVEVGGFQFENATLQLTIGTQPTIALGGKETVTVTVTNTSANPLPADNSLLTVTLTGGLTTGGPLTFTVGALAAGQSATFSIPVNAASLGTQTITAAVTSVDTNPATVTTMTTVNVQMPTTLPPPPVTGHTPVGNLTTFAFGFGPTGLDLFEIDQAGDIFAVPFMGGGAPIFLSTALQLPLAVFQKGQFLAFLTGANGQNFLIDITNPFVPQVESALLAALQRK